MAESPTGAARATGVFACCCWVLIVTGLTTFAFFWSVTPTRWYRMHDADFLAWHSGKNLDLQQKVANASAPSKSPLLPGGLGFTIAWQWGTTLAVALGSAGLLWLSSAPSSHIIPTTSQPKAPPTRSVTRPSLMGKVVTRARRLLSFRLPPRGLWRRLLGPSGLSVTELLLVVAWVLIHFMWMHEMTTSVLEIRRANPPPPPEAFFTPPVAVAGAGAQTELTSSTMQRVLLQRAADSTNETAAPGPAVALPPPSPKLKPLPHEIQDSMTLFGWVGRLDLLLLFFPLPRCNFLHWLLDSDFPALIKYHRWLGQGTLMMYTLHGVLFLAVWARDGMLKVMLDWGLTGAANNLAGLVSMFGGWVLWVTCIPIIRRRMFNLFYVSHITGVIVFLLFGFMHCKHVATWVLPGIFLYLLDVVLRTIQQNFNATRVSAAAVADTGLARATVSPDGGMLTLAIACDKSMCWVGSDIVFLNIPTISWWQWHPFTLASSSSTVAPAAAAATAAVVGSEEGGGERRMVLHIKKYNVWTKGLISRLASDTAPLTLYVSGPYHGANRKWLSKYDRHVFVSGGLGVTSALGMLQELIAHRRAAATSAAASFGGPAAGRVTFIWLSRSADELDTLLPADVFEEATKGKDSWLDLQLYHTGAAASGDAATAAASLDTDATAAAGSIMSCVKGFYGHRSAADVAVTLLCAPGFLLTAAAASAVQAKPLAHPYMFSPLLWVAAVTLCFAGGFAGLLCSQAYDAHSSGGARSDLMGILQCVGLGLGAVLGPALLMSAAHVHRAHATRRARTQQKQAGTFSTATSVCMDHTIQQAGASPGSSPSKRLESMGVRTDTTTYTASSDGRGSDPDGGVSTATTMEPLSLPSLPLSKTVIGGLPGMEKATHNTYDTYGVCTPDQIHVHAVQADAPAASAFTIRGRPDLAAVLARAAANSAASAAGEGVEECVGVFVGGPPSLVGAVEDACASLNGVWGSGAQGRAFLAVRSTTHEL